MSGDRYHITDQHATYFITFTIVDWIDIFTRPEYKTIIIESLNHCVANKGWEIYAWVLMTNHLHLVTRTHPPFRMSDVIRDFKKYTSKKIAVAIEELPESRKEWLLHKFSYHAQSSGRAKDYKIWQDGNHAICLENPAITRQKVNYIHNNPVRAMIVSEPESYLFSSASVYAGSKQALVKVSLFDGD